MSHYDVLGVPRDVAPDDLHRAYVALARRHHPDRPGGDAVRMQAVNEAWAILGDPTRRSRYDRSLVGDTTATAPRGPGAWPADADRRSWEDLEDLDDDQAPVVMVLPRWLALLPVGLFATSIAVGVVGLVVGLPAVAALALILFVLSTMLFLSAPFIALFVSRRSNR